MAMLVSMLALLVSVVSARVNLLAVAGVAQDAAKEEGEVYSAFFEANKAKDIPKAVGFAKAYLEKFPTGKYAGYLKGWLRPHLFNEAITAKKTDDMIRIGKEALAAEPDNLDYLYLMALNIRTNELSASPPNYSHGAEAAEFSQRAIKLIEGGKVPAVVPKENWKQGPILGMLYQSVGLVAAKNKETDKALENYKKAATLDPSSPIYFLNMGSIYQEKYGTAAAKYQAFPQADRDAAELKPEVKAALDEVNTNADMVIENLARFMALTAGQDPWKSTRDQVLAALTTMYNYRHPNDADGMQKLIDKFKSNGAPAGGASAAASKQ
jgi:tetratricopeptide (TPR) repeat protein